MRMEEKQVSRNNSTTPTTVDGSRRNFIKKAAYAAPAILSLQAYSAVAKNGSGKEPGKCELQKGSRKRRKPKSC